MDTPQRLRMLRRAAGKTQQAVAAAIGCAPRSYQNWEYGVVKPSHKYAQRLAEYFDTTAAFILYGDTGPVTTRTLNAKLDLLLAMLGQCPHPDSNWGPAA